MSGGRYVKGPTIAHPWPWDHKRFRTMVRVRVSGLTLTVASRFTVGEMNYPTTAWQVHLVRHPEGLPTPEESRLVEVPLPAVYDRTFKSIPVVTRKHS
jgi:hypothetical protein